ncbi:MAG: hypothetical protein HUJ26_20480 [Planctomycetaceae bacterium]|nr:hypothetical protein [Planctomycetaceae bacterium]
MTPPVQLRARLLPVLCFLMTSVIGCGTEVYNQRVAATKELFEYINKLDENLGQPWAQSGVEIRMPKQMVEIPAPKFERNEEGQLVQVGEDLRQPNYMSEELPGLIGAWQGTVEADVAGEFKQVPAYAYIMSNSVYLAKNDPEAAMEFSNKVAETIVNGLNLPPYDPSDWNQKQYPPSPGLVPQQSASVWVTKTDYFIGETKAEISLHLFGQGDTTVYVLFVYPETITSNERFIERIDLSLETIKISDDRQQTGTAPGTAPNAPPSGF